MYHHNKQLYNTAITATKHRRGSNTLKMMLKRRPLIENIESLKTAALGSDQRYIFKDDTSLTLKHNRKEGNDQESIQLPNTVRPRHQRERRTHKKHGHCVQKKQELS